jgi:hypothetical protein
MKRCARCERVLPLDAFACQADALTGRRSHCRACVRDSRERDPLVQLRRLARLAALHERREAAQQAVETGAKPCVTCGEVQPLDSFWKRTDRLDGHSSSCSACIGIRRNAPDPEDEERVSRWRAQEREFERLIEEARREL